VPESVVFLGTLPAGLFNKDWRVTNLFQFPPFTCDELERTALNKACGS